MIVYNQVEEMKEKNQFLDNFFFEPIVHVSRVSWRGLVNQNTIRQLNSKPCPDNNTRERAESEFCLLVNCDSLNVIASLNSNFAVGD